MVFPLKELAQVLSTMNINTCISFPVKSIARCYMWYFDLESDNYVLYTYKILNRNRALHISITFRFCLQILTRKWWRSFLPVN